MKPPGRGGGGRAAGEVAGKEGTAAPGCAAVALGGGSPSAKFPQGPGGVVRGEGASPAGGRHRRAGWRGSSPAFPLGGSLSHFIPELEAAGWGAGGRRAFSAPALAWGGCGDPRSGLGSTGKKKINKKNKLKKGLIVVT